MDQEYLLDTNAFYNLLNAIKQSVDCQDSLPDQTSKLITEKLIISTITEVEIISVLGKYARGSQGGFQKCNCRISLEGDICPNNRYSEPRKKWKTRQIKAWLHFINEILGGKSRLLNINIEPFNTDTIEEAKRVIVHALAHNFASMDAMIAATAKLAQEHSRNVIVITSDKGLKACLDKINVPYCDVFAAQ